MTEQSFNYTPSETCESIINYLNLDSSKSYVEPFSGNHNFYNLLPDNKEYYEIQEGKDFFECDRQYDVLLTNPPYRDFETDSKNIFIKCLEKCFDVALEKCIFLINNNIFLIFVWRKFNIICDKISNNALDFRILKILEIHF